MACARMVSGIRIVCGFDVCVENIGTPRPLSVGKVAAGGRWVLAEAPMWSLGPLAARGAVGARWMLGVAVLTTMSLAPLVVDGRRVAEV